MLPVTTVSRTVVTPAAGSLAAGVSSFTGSKSGKGAQMETETAPVVETPAPVVETPAPVVETPAPVVPTSNGKKPAMTVGKLVGVLVAFVAGLSAIGLAVVACVAFVVVGLMWPADNGRVARCTAGYRLYKPVAVCMPAPKTQRKLGLVQVVEVSGQPRAWSFYGSWNKIGSGSKK